MASIAPIQTTWPPATFDPSNSFNPEPIKSKFGNMGKILRFMNSLQIWEESVHAEELEFIHDQVLPVHFYGKSGLHFLTM